MYVLFTNARDTGSTHYIVKSNSSLTILGVIIDNYIDNKLMIRLRPIPPALPLETDRIYLLFNIASKPCCGPLFGIGWCIGPV